MSLSPEQIALLRDAAKCAGLKLLAIPWHEQFGFGIDLPGDASDTWHPLIDHGDLYDLMAAGKVIPAYDYSYMWKTEGGNVSKCECTDDFTSQAWAVITVCAMAERRKGE